MPRNAASRDRHCHFRLPVHLAVQTVVRRDLLAWIRIDADGTNQDCSVGLGGHNFVEFSPVARFTTDSGGVDGPKQRRHAAGLEPCEVIVGTGEIGIALDRDPVPAGSKHDGRARPRSQVGELPDLASRDEPDNGLTGHRVIEYACVHHRGLSRAIDTIGEDDGEATLTGAEFARVI